MALLYPGMLWALMALAIPIAVHLFNFRRHKQVYFSNTALLKTIQQENAKTKKLKYLVALMLRCLFIVALVLAFAFPFQKDSAVALNTEEGVVGVYLDNSMSMKAQSSKTTLLEDARESAKSLVKRLSPSTRYLLITNSFEVQNEYPMNQEEMLDQLDRMKMEGNPLKMNEVLERFQMLRKRHGFDRATLFAYSDFQRNMLDMSGVKADSALQVVVVPMVSEQRANLTVDTLWLGSPVMQVDLANELHVKVSNQGEKAVKGLPVNLTVDGKVTASGTVDVEGQDDAELVLQFLLQDPGTLRCQVSLMDYPITFDDSYCFTVEPHPSLRVVELTRVPKESSVSLVFADDPQFNFQAMDPQGIDLQALAKAHLVVVDETSSINETLRQTLEEDAAEGASVVFFHDDGKVIDTNTLNFNTLAIKHEFFNDMILDMPHHADLPKVKQHVRLMPSPESTTLISLDNGDPLLLMKPVGKGFVFDFATTLDARWSTLADHSLFVPMMLKMALMGGGVNRMSYTLGTDDMLMFNDIDVEGDREMKIRNEDGTYEMMLVNEVRNNRVCVFLREDLPAAGFYELWVNDSLAHVLAWNDSRLESEMEFVEGQEIKKAFKSAGQEVMAVLQADEFAQHDLVDAMARKSSLWKWFVLLALLALAGEVAVLRFWK